MPLATGQYEGRRSYIRPIFFQHYGHKLSPRPAEPSVSLLTPSEPQIVELKAVSLLLVSCYLFKCYIHASRDPAMPSKLADVEFVLEIRQTAKDIPQYRRDTRLHRNGNLGWLT